ncbi:ATP-dependent zinc metalloprotease FtsH [Calycomorphotria hydatis]|uniref:ATP-dependent zinc metalloprotease FtsH n=1 Tax=Calycomorphotria hydatis TaxID=2528027 RepID=A0A517T9D3_9PLAN|nr:ATP-dependent zinc metalloprotease FtsH [Calycomorphotria hydatis]QDT64976.1 ATP-dependent zinc metalloprotease FtsH [Calycomorphotria hydatis]
MSQDGSQNTPTPPQQDKPRQSPEEQESKGPMGGGSALFLILMLGLLAFFIFGQWGGNNGEEVDWNVLVDKWETGKIARLEIIGETYAAKLKPEEDKADADKAKDDKHKEPLEIFAIAPPGAELDPKIQKLREQDGLEIRATSTTLSVGTQIMLYLMLPMLLIGFIWFSMRRSADPFGGGMFGNFVRSPAKRFRATDQQTTFEDVAGMDTAKEELTEIVSFLKSPGKFQRLGATIPKGVLLMGAPGTGKTLIARATAGEAGVPFYSINGSEFIQMFVGVGASRVRDMFQTAKENAPCLLFIDEIDAVGRERGAGLGGGHDEREQTLNQILSEMDGFTPTETVIVMAATNRPDVLDPALLRPGRFDRHIQIDRPNKKGRVEILKVHCRKVPLADDVDLESIATSCIGFSGAEIRNLVNEAALLATRQEKSAVDMSDFDEARDKVLMGPQREEMLNEHERRMTAYHEAGHALLAWLLPNLDPVHKVTIVPRGRSLGLTQLLPDEETYNIGERKLHDQLTMVLGGRAAEKLIFDEYSAGAEDDIKKGTQLARRMVARWGMSEVIGPVMFKQGEEHPFLGKEMREHRDFSESTAHVIDKEIQRFLFEAGERATSMLNEHRDELDTLAEKLLADESLTKSEIAALIGERATVEELADN